MTPRILSAALLLAACATPEPTEPEVRPIYPPPPDPPRVQFLMSVSASGDVETGPTALDHFLFGEAADVEQRIARPMGVAVRDGMVYVLDAGLRPPGLHRIDLDGRLFDAIVPGGRGQMKLPLDMHVAKDGNAYIADRERKQVLVYDKDWRFVRELGPWAKESAPVAVWTWQDRVFVADPAGRCVRVVDDATGEQIAVIETDENRPEAAIRTPTGLAVDDNGYVYIVDAIYQRVLVFDKDLHFVRQIGEPGDVPGFFGRPKAIAIVDRTVWVLDSLYENCQILDLTGKPLMFFGGGGTGPGDLYLPRRLWVGEEGLDLFRDRLDADFEPEKLIAVVSGYGERLISFYALGRSRLPQFRDRYADLDLPDRPVPLSPDERKPGQGRETESTVPTNKEPETGRR